MPTPPSSSTPRNSRCVPPGTDTTSVDSRRFRNTVADADTFVFKPPAGATKIDLDSGAMAEFDELPPGIPSGAKK